MHIYSNFIIIYFELFTRFFLPPFFPSNNFFRSRILQSGKNSFISMQTAGNSYIIYVLHIYKYFLCLFFRLVWTREIFSVVVGISIENYYFSLAFSVSGVWISSFLKIFTYARSRVSLPCCLVCHCCSSVRNTFTAFFNPKPIHFSRKIINIVWWNYTRWFFPTFLRFFFLSPKFALM